MIARVLRLCSSNLQRHLVAGRIGSPRKKNSGAAAAATFLKEADSSSSCVASNVIPTVGANL